MATMVFVRRKESCDGYMTTGSTEDQNGAMMATGVASRPQR